MTRSIRLKWKLTVASLKMFYRQREAILWTLLFPLFMIFLFGFVKFDGLGHVTLGIVNDAGGKVSTFLEALKDVKTLKLVEGNRAEELLQLEKGEREMVLIIPASFDPSANDSLLAYVNDEKPQEAQVGALILQRVMDELAFRRSPPANRIVLVTQPVRSRNLTYIDFLLPGILSMSIMQMGIFGVAFGLVSLKKRGILRRLWVTPMQPSDFVLAQVAFRLVIVMVQIVVMILVGVYFFNLHFIGSFGALFVIGVLGAVVFLSMGFAIAGISRTEDQVAPVANIISLPMMLLSGVFFNRSNLPGFVHTITDFFPLTYLADGMRSIAIDGATLAETTPQLIGLSVWCVVACVIAVKMFRWE